MGGEGCHRRAAPRRRRRERARAVGPERGGAATFVGGGVRAKRLPGLLALLAALTWAWAPAAARNAPAPIAFVPLDDRPVTYQLPLMLGEIAGVDVRTPPAALFGHYLTPGDPDGILRWLGGERTAGVSALVVSSDMAVYGGLVAARVDDASLYAAVSRIRRLGALRADRPGAWFAVFGTVMRLAPTWTPQTAQQTQLITRYANLPDPPQTLQEREESQRLAERLGPALQRYLAARRRDAGVDLWILQLAAQGDFDRIVLGQDDAGRVGLHVKDVRALERAQRSFALGENSSIEPGADELGMTLLAHAIAREAGWQPRIAVHYSTAQGPATQDPLEFTTADQTINHLIALSGSRRDDGSDHDVTLFVRAPGTSAQQEQTFLDDIAAALPTQVVAVADLSFLMSRDMDAQRELTEDLIARGIAGKIDAFASWNTTANTVGTALAEALTVGAAKRMGTYDERAHAQFMLDRYADDFAFHDFVRSGLNSALTERDVRDHTLLFDDALSFADHYNRATLWPHALTLLTQIYPQYRDAGLTITLPWERTFETKLDVRLDPGRP
ncbi:DUF4127 family protein [bacterium]|nr:MAG: DUF4127 family protein [bacterium]